MVCNLPKAVLIIKKNAQSPKKLIVKEWLLPTVSWMLLVWCARAADTETLHWIVVLISAFIWSTLMELNRPLDSWRSLVLKSLLSTVLLLMAQDTVGFGYQPIAWQWNVTSVPTWADRSPSRMLTFPFSVITKTRNYHFDWHFQSPKVHIRTFQKQKKWF